MLIKSIINILQFIQIMISKNINLKYFLQKNGFKNMFFITALILGFSIGLFWN